MKFLNHVCMSLRAPHCPKEGRWHGAKHPLALGWVLPTCAYRVHVSILLGRSLAPMHVSHAITAPHVYNTERDCGQDDRSTPLVYTWMMNVSTAHGESGGTFPTTADFLITYVLTYLHTSYTYPTARTTLPRPTVEYLHQGINCGM